MQAQVNGTELFYTTHGSGRPMLVMHGGLGLDHAYFRPWLDELGDVAELIYYDHRGNGKSARPANWEGITHATWADDADALRAQLGHEQVILYGHSYGGFLALEYALRHGEQLAGLILSCTAPALDYPEVILANAERRGSPEIMQTVMTGLADPTDSDEGYRALMGAIMPLYFKRYDPEVARQIDAVSTYSGGAFRHSFTACIPSYNVLDRLSEINTPTLILSGREDWITPPAQGGERLHAGLPNSELVIFEESGHFPFIEEPQRFNAVVKDWVRRLEGTGNSGLIEDEPRWLPRT
jgi:proline iminopeptidase